MVNPTEHEERAHLEHVKARLGDAFDQLHTRVRRYADQVRDQKTYLWEHRADMDHVEKVSVREAAQQTVLSAEAVLAERKRIERLVQTPYFGRFDFVRNDTLDPLPVYVGIHSFHDDAQRTQLVFDWRAPISTMFYDHEIGEARYQAPGGAIAGRLTVKRQFRIRGGELEFMLESGLNIVDDVLQKELSRTSDDRMKNIVATIQRDQNAIVRNEDARALVIQGVAGSGKTSIALHRIAFLLYRFKESLSSRDVLILSPNRVFGDFISNVLPELGEEPIPEMQMETLATELLDGKHRFQTFLDQSVALLEGSDDALRRRIEEKSSLEFLERLEEYAAHALAARFRPDDVVVDGHLVPAAFVERCFRRRQSGSVSERLRAVVEAVEHELSRRRRDELTAKERAGIRSAVKGMHRSPSLRTTYREYFDWLGKPELFKTARGASLEYSDVFPLIYLKLRLEGAPARYRAVKHLVVDEMQDYTPVQYAVLEKLFSCDKTILGDVNQSLSVLGSSPAEVIARVVAHAECVKLCKSYRSSYEITRFAQSISPDADLIAVERHGGKPIVVACSDATAEERRILKAIQEFAASGHQTLGIICRTQREAVRLHGVLEAGGAEAQLLTARSAAFRRGVVVCSVHLAKGLEFDHVIVPHATAENYATALDRNLLYVACTRAMHRLLVTHAGARTPLIADLAVCEASDGDAAAAA